MTLSKRNKNIDIYIIRHAESCQNSGDSYTSLFHEDDAPLSEKGKRQAQALASRFNPGDIDRIYSSTLIRTAQTVLPTANKLAKNIIILPELREANTACQGEPQEKITRLIPGGITYSHSGSPTGYPQHYGEETTEMLTARAKTVLDYILEQACENEKIIITTHCAYFGYLVRYLLGIELPESFCWQVNNCGVTHIKMRRNDIPVVVCANDRAHLSAI